MVKACATPSDRSVTSVTFGNSDDMRHTLAARHHAVVATGARSDDLGVIHFDGGTPCRRGMAHGAFGG